jgi:hypothetical protein
MDKKNCCSFLQEVGGIHIAEFTGVDRTAIKRNFHKGVLVLARCCCARRLHYFLQYPGDICFGIF